MPTKQHSTSEDLSGSYVAPLFSPRGEIEGVLVKNKRGVTTQLVLERDQHDVVSLIKDLDPGTELVAEVSGMVSSKKGAASHEVRALVRIVSINGTKTKNDRSNRIFKGKVERLHYARHGEPNGVILDSGDFIHLKPHGFREARISVGDLVEARGPSRALATGGGSVVEADAINGSTVAKKRTPESH